MVVSDWGVLVHQCDILQFPLELSGLFHARNLFVGGKQSLTHENYLKTKVTRARA